MSKQKRKQRHQAKRDAKRASKRRQNSISPVKRLADAPGAIECWMSEDFESLGQRTIIAHKRGAGLDGVACFLIDRGVVGLKDAYVRMNIDRAGLRDILASCAENGVTLRPAAVDDVRPCIAAAARWAHENGMRLPKDWLKTASLIGGVGDWSSADVSAFVKEFAGHPDDLRQRLIAEPFDTYVRRPDILFEFNEDAPFMDQHTGEYQNNEPSLGDLTEEELEEIAADVPLEELTAIAEKFTPAATALAAQTVAWLPTTEPASPELFEAWRSILTASLISRTSMPDAEEEEVAKFGFELLQDMSARIEPSRAAEYDRAVGQALRHLQTDTTMMQNAVLTWLRK